MPTVRVRDLGSVGIVTDVAPENLPVNAFSEGCNVRFDERGICRGSVFRLASNFDVDMLAMTTQQDGQSNYDRILAVGQRLDVYDVSTPGISTLDELIPALSGIAINDTQPSLCTLLGNVVINRQDNVPFYVPPRGDELFFLPGWPDSDENRLRAKVIRSYGDNLVAVRLTKNGAPGGERSIRLSSFGRGVLPNSWDITDPTTGATEIAFDVEDPLEDALQLGNQLLVYTRREAIALRRVGGTLLYANDRLPGYRGVFGPNCAVEVGNQHVCFGPEDIILHSPGTRPESICAGRVKRFIYDHIDYGATEDFFVMRMDHLNEVWFCHRTNWFQAKWRNITSGCNFAAIWNWSNGQWSFADLPAITAGTTSNLQVLDEAYDDDIAPIAFDEDGGTWDSTDDTSQRFPIVVGRKSLVDPEARLPFSKMMVVDGLDNRSRTPLPLAEDTWVKSFVERSGLDLDQEQNLPLDSYKHVRHLYAQGDLKDNVLYLSIGGHFAPRQFRQLTQAQSIAVVSDYRCDLRTGGRYVAYRLSSDTRRDFALSGFDMEIAILGRR